MEISLQYFIIARLNYFVYALRAGTDPYGARYFMLALSALIMLQLHLNLVFRTVRLLCPPKKRAQLNINFGNYGA